MRKFYDPENVKGRLNAYITKYERSNIKAFEKRVGLPQGMVSREHSVLSFASLVKIANNCPDLSLRWLLTGNGQMIEKGDEINVTNKGKAGQVAGNVYNMGETNISVETICEEVKSLQGVIVTLQQEKKQILETVSNLQDTNEKLHDENMKLLGIIEKLTYSPG